MSDYWVRYDEDGEWPFLVKTDRERGKCRYYTALCGWKPAGTVYLGVYDETNEMHWEFEPISEEELNDWYGDAWKEPEPDDAAQEERDARVLRETRESLKQFATERKLAGDPLPEQLLQRLQSSLGN